jgi:hippurate hydrolase
MPLPVGTFITCAPGVSAPAADYFKIKVSGKGCHGSTPSEGVDPVSVASHIVIALQEINARELKMGERAALTIGTFNAGTADNVIPDSAMLGGSIRTFNEDTRSFLKERIVDISRGIAQSFRAEAEVTFGGGCPSLLNDAALSEAVNQYLGELFGAMALSAASFEKNNVGGAAGSEDFAYISRQVPSIMTAVAAGGPKEGYIYPQHHQMVTFDENVLPLGAAAYAYVAMRRLNELI